MKKRIPVIPLAALLVLSASFAESPESSPQAPEDYRIGIEDILQISVWEEPELNMGVGVRPDGKISFPLVNDFLVAGLTPSEVREAITKKLATFIREPQVTVIVTQINSFKVYIIGDVNNQGVFTFTRPTRVLGAIAHAGGFDEFSKKQITVLRETNGVEVRLSVNYKEILAGDHAQSNFYLQPGDTLVVN